MLRRRAAEQDDGRVIKEPVEPGAFDHTKRGGSRRLGEGEAAGMIGHRPTAQDDDGVCAVRVLRPLNGGVTAVGQRGQPVGHGGCGRDPEHGKHRDEVRPRPCTRTPPSQQQQPDANPQEPHDDRVQPHVLLQQMDQRRHREITVQTSEA